MTRELRILMDELDDSDGDQPYEESHGVWICRRCAAEIYHRDSFCRYCKRADTHMRRRQRGHWEEKEEEESDDE